MAVASGAKTWRGRPGGGSWHSGFWSQKTWGGALTSISVAVWPREAPIIVRVVIWGYSFVVVGRVRETWLSEALGKQCSAPPGLRGLRLLCSRYSQRRRGGEEGGRGGGGRRGSCGDQEQQSEGQSERKRQKGWVLRGEGGPGPYGEQGPGPGVGAESVGPGGWGHGVPGG